jgi:hypothetical protein
MIHFEDVRNANDFRSWIIDVMLVAAQSAADAQLVKRVLEQAQAYSKLITVKK